MDVSEADFETLINADEWPNTEQILEFVNTAPPKRTLENFMPDTLKQPPAKTQQKDEKKKQDESEEIKVDDHRSTDAMEVTKNLH